MLLLTISHQFSIRQLGCPSLSSEARTCPDGWCYWNIYLCSPAILIKSKHAYIHIYPKNQLSRVAGITLELSKKWCWTTLDTKYMISLTSSGHSITFKSLFFCKRNPHGTCVTPVTPIFWFHHIALSVPQCVGSATELYLGDSPIASHCLPPPGTLTFWSCTYAHLSWTLSNF